MGVLFLFFSDFFPSCCCAKCAWLCVIFSLFLLFLLFLFVSFCFFSLFVCVGVCVCLFNLFVYMSIQEWSPFWKMMFIADRLQQMMLMWWLFLGGGTSQRVLCVHRRLHIWYSKYILYYIYNKATKGFHIWSCWGTFKPLSVTVANKGKETRTCGETSSSGWGEGDRRASTYTMCIVYTALTCATDWICKTCEPHFPHDSWRTRVLKLESSLVYLPLRISDIFSLATTHSSALFAGGAQKLFGQNSWKASWMPSEAHHRVEGSAEPHMKTILIEFDHVWDVLGIFFFESSGLVRTLYIQVL